MSDIIWKIAISSFMFMGISTASASLPAGPSRPNIVFIVADDLDWNNVG